MIDACSDYYENKGEQGKNVADCLEASKPAITFFWKAANVVAKVYWYLFEWVMFFYEWASARTSRISHREHAHARPSAHVALISA